MPRLYNGALAPALFVILVMAVCAVPGMSQTRRSVPVGRASMEVSLLDADTTNTSEMAHGGPLPVSIVAPDSGLTALDLVRRALGSNAELAARRLDIDRARALLHQAGLRPNPRIEFEHGSGRIVGNPGERETTVGVSIPLEISGQRGRRIDLAEAELAAAEAEYAERERRLSADVSSAFVEALAAERDVETYRRLSALDVEIMRIVEARIAEGESAPLELNLIQVETDRLRSQAALADGRILTAMLRLKRLVGARFDEALQLRHELAPLALPASPDALPSREEAIATALRSRPDLRFARLNVAIARAGLRLAEARARPDVSIIGRYSVGRSLTELPAPFAPAPDNERTLAIGVSVSLPVFDRNQGAKADAAISITQAERLLAFAESAVRIDVESAYGRYEAARRAVEIFEQHVLVRSSSNVATIREAYQLGVYRVTDLIAEQRRFADVERDYTAALAEARQAQAALLAAVGAPPVDRGRETKDENDDR